MGDHDLAIQAGERAVAAADALRDIPLQIVANYLVAYPYRDRGDFARAIDGLRRGIASIEDDPLHERFGLVGYPAPLARSCLAWCLAEIGEFDEGAACGEVAVRMGETLESPFSLAYSLLHLGHLHLRRGQVDEAIAVLERGTAICQSLDFRTIVSDVAARLGAAYTVTGRAADGLPLLEQWVEQAESWGHWSEAPVRCAWLGEAYLAVGRGEDASGLAERALQVAEAQKGSADRAWALRLLGEIAARREPPLVEKAETHYRQALVLAEELGMRPLQAHCHLGLGHLNRRVGRRDDARAELATAVPAARRHEDDVLAAGGRGGAGGGDRLVARQG